LKIFKKILNESNKVFDTVLENYFQKNVDKVVFDYPDAIILGLLENIINHSKTIIILIENKHQSSLDTIMRTLFENYVYLLFILKRETELRSKSYAYSNKIRELNLYRKLSEDSLEGKKLRDFIKADKEKLDEIFLSKRDFNYMERIENTYFSEIGMKRNEQKWYNFNDGTNNFKKLCSNLGLSVEYDLIYSLLSTETHAKDAIKNFKFSEFGIDLIQKIDNYNLCVNLSSLYLLHSVRMIYKHYGLNKELKSFNTIIAVNHKYS